MAKTNRIVFQNSNGIDYCIVAGTDKRALLRDMNSGYYVIATNLDWRYRCWGGGSYYSVDEFELAVRAFLAKGEG